MSVKMINQKSINTVEDIQRLVAKGEVKGIMIAGFHSKGSVVTGWGDIDCCQMATLIGHLQVDLMNRFIQTNYVTPK